MKKRLGKRRNSQSGMTLMELLVVLLILSVIAAFAVPRVLNYVGGAKADGAAIQIERLDGILELYQFDTGRVPTTQEGLLALLSAPDGVSGWNGPYLKKESALSDPWGAPYRYSAPGKHGAYDLYSLGADGQVGGEGDAADVTNW